MFYFTKKPWILKQIYGDCVWDYSNEEKTIYLTFDDGPHPEETPFILEQLKQYNAIATFFCLGRNVAAFNDIYQSVIEDGHAIGNHTFDHFDGWRTSNNKYFDNIEKAGKLIHSSLFRPPYGHITKFEVNKLKQKYHLKTIMWSVMAGDFDQKTSGHQCLHNVIDNAVSGSIIVFHDNDSASKNLRYALPGTLEHYSNLGYTFKKIES